MLTIRPTLLGFLLALATPSLSLAASPSEQRMYAGDIAGALELAKDEATSRPDDVAAQERYIDLLLGLGRGGVAVQSAQGRVAANPTSADAQYLLGRALPDARSARAAYERALKLDPLHARSHMGMGAIHTAEGDIQAAADAYAFAVRTDAQLPEAWLGLARAQLGQGDTAAAIQTSERAIAAVPSSPDAYLTIAVIDPSRAADMLKKGTLASPDDPRLPAALAEAQLSVGQGKAALRHARRALSIDPTQAVAERIHFFAVEMADGRLDLQGYETLLASRQSGRAADLDAEIARLPSSASLLLQRSQAHRAVGADAEALADLEAARSLRPGEPEILGQLGLLYLDLKRPADAAVLLSKAAEARPWDLSLMLNAARAASLADRHTDALERFATLSKFRPGDQEVTIAYADALLRARKPEAAYQVVLAGAEQGMSDRLIVALIATAAAAERYIEAAEVLEQIADGSNNAKARQLATELRAKARK